MSLKYQSSSFENNLSVQVDTTTSKLFQVFFFILALFNSRNVPLLLFKCLPGKR